MVMLAEFIGLRNLPVNPHQYANEMGDTDYDFLVKEIQSVRGSAFNWHSKLSGYCSYYGCNMKPVKGVMCWYHRTMTRVKYRRQYALRRRHQ